MVKNGKKEKRVVKNKKNQDRKLKQAPKLEIGEKYNLYESAVQCPDYDAEFFHEKFKEIHGIFPRTLREDFCGTGRISCEWVKLNPKNYATGIDLDMEPIRYGQDNHVSQLSPSQKKRIQYVRENVLT